LENGEADPKAGYAIFQVIEGDIAVANQQYDKAIASIDRTLSVLQEMGQKVFLPDILRCKGEALFGMGRNDEARTILQEALALAEEQNSRRASWAILFSLSRLANHTGDDAEAKGLRTRALDVIQYMAEHAGSEESKTAFLDSPRLNNSWGPCSIVCPVLRLAQDERHIPFVISTS
jgi:tetratricopeptide (TPR) repeat protein